MGFQDILFGCLSSRPTTIQELLLVTSWSQLRKLVACLRMFKLTWAQKMVQWKLSKLLLLVKTVFTIYEAPQTSTLRVGGHFFTDSAHSIGMNIFEDLKDVGHFTGDYLDKNLIRFCFTNIVQVRYNCWC